MTVRSLAAARIEAVDAAAWYDARWLGLGDVFLNAVDRAIDRDPTRYPVEPIRGRRSRDVRRYTLKRFSYSVIYEIRLNELVVIAVPHHRQRRYWLNRLTP